MHKESVQLSTDCRSQGDPSGPALPPEMIFDDSLAKKKNLGFTFPKEDSSAPVPQTMRLDKSMEGISKGKRKKPKSPNLAIPSGNASGQDDAPIPAAMRFDTSLDKSKAKTRKERCNHRASKNHSSGNENQVDISSRSSPDSSSDIEEGSRRSNLQAPNRSANHSARQTREQGDDAFNGGVLVANAVLVTEPEIVHAEPIPDEEPRLDPPSSELPTTAHRHTRHHSSNHSSNESLHSPNQAGSPSQASNASPQMYNHHRQHRKQNRRPHGDRRLISPLDGTFSDDRLSPHSHATKQGHKAGDPHVDERKSSTPREVNPTRTAKISIRKRPWWESWGFFSVVALILFILAICLIAGMVLVLRGGAGTEDAGIHGYDEYGTENGFDTSEEGLDVSTKIKFVSLVYHILLPLSSQFYPHPQFTTTTSTIESPPQIFDELEGSSSSFVDTSLPTTAINTPIEIEVNVLIDNGSSMGTSTIQYVESDGKHGTCAINESGTSIIYTPDVGYFGRDNCGFYICDEEQTCSTSSVDITVLPEAEETVSGEYLRKHPLVPHAACFFYAKLRSPHISIFYETGYRESRRVDND